MRRPIQPGFYRHFKGGLYFVVGEAAHSEEVGTSMIIYISIPTAKWWARPSTKFWNLVDNNKLRFTPVNHNSEVEGLITRYLDAINAVMRAEEDDDVSA